MAIQAASLSLAPSWLPLVFFSALDLCYPLNPHLFTACKAPLPVEADSGTGDATSHVLLDRDWPARALKETNHVSTTLVHLRRYLPTHQGIKVSANAMDTLVDAAVAVIPTSLFVFFKVETLVCSVFTMHGKNQGVSEGGNGNGSQVDSSDGDIGEGDDFYNDGDGDGGGSDE
ncbi:hypothetical protein C8R42DRAFT_646442 [Lentinula raphanica]|nr:hypothetical protein C8R42DRAFT_646442 [Lentinula raphanica]